MKWLSLKIFVHISLIKRKDAVLYIDSFSLLCYGVTLNSSWRIVSELLDLKWQSLLDVSFVSEFLAGEWKDKKKVITVQNKLSGYKIDAMVIFYSSLNVYTFSDLPGILKHLENREA